MNSKDYAKVAFESMEEKKAFDIKIIKIAEISSIADYFIIGTGDNPRQVHAISDNIHKELSQLGIEPKQIEGYQNANWVLMDYGDIIVHIFDKENRQFYDLERIWKDGKEIVF